MQNLEQLIQAAGTVIEDYTSRHTKCFDLFCQEGKFICSERCLPSLMPYYVRHFSKAQSSEGLTGPQWRKLGLKAQKLIKEATE